MSDEFTPAEATPRPPGIWERIKGLILRFLKGT